MFRTKRLNGLYTHEDTTTHECANPSTQNIINTSMHKLTNLKNINPQIIVKQKWNWNAIAGIVSKQKAFLFFCVKVYWCYPTHALHSSNKYFPTAILFDYKNSKAHKLKKHQPQNSKTQKPKLLFLFYKNTLFFAPF